MRHRRADATSSARYLHLLGVLSPSPRRATARSSRCSEPRGDARAGVQDSSSTKGVAQRRRAALRRRRRTVAARSRAARRCRPAGDDPGARDERPAPRRPRPARQQLDRDADQRGRRQGTRFTAAPAAAALRHDGEQRPRLVVPPIASRADAGVYVPATEHDVIRARPRAAATTRTARLPSARGGRRRCGERADAAGASDRRGERRATERVEDHQQHAESPSATATAPRSQPAARRGRGTAVGQQVCRELARAHALTGPTWPDSAQRMPQLIESPQRRRGRGHSTPRSSRSTSCQVNTAGWPRRERRAQPLARGPARPRRSGPELDAWTAVLDGTLDVEHDDGGFDVRLRAGVPGGPASGVRYSSPQPGGAHYVAVCLRPSRPRRHPRRA